MATRDDWSGYLSQMVYGDGARRPDITFRGFGSSFSCQPAVTDVSIAFPTDTSGSAASEAAKRELREHSDATSRLEHAFIPCAVEIFGHRDRSCFRLIKRLAHFLPAQELYA